MFESNNLHLSFHSVFLTISKLSEILVDRDLKKYIKQKIFVQDFNNGFECCFLIEFKARKFLIRK